MVAVSPPYIPPARVTFRIICMHPPLVVERVVGAAAVELPVQPAMPVVRPSQLQFIKVKSASSAQHSLPRPAEKGPQAVSEQTAHLGNPAESAARPITIARTS